LISAPFHSPGNCHLIKVNSAYSLKLFRQQVTLLKTESFLGSVCECPFWSLEYFLLFLFRIFFTPGLPFCINLQVLFLITSKTISMSTQLKVKARINFNKNEMIYKKIFLGRRAFKLQWVLVNANWKQFKKMYSNFWKVKINIILLFFL